MDRIDRLLMRVTTGFTKYQALMKDNPYLEKSYEELLDMMNPETADGYTAPDKGNREWEKFICAIMHNAGTELMS